MGVTPLVGVALDTIEPLLSEVGYGTCGRGGDLGYENGVVVVDGERPSSALSTHGPARLLFDIGGGFARFRCRVALNEDVPAGRSWATFTVLADGTVAVEATRVGPGDVVAIDARLDGARLLELLVTTSEWAFCHAVWIDPTLEPSSSSWSASSEPEVVDPLGRAALGPPTATAATVDRCIATVVSPGFERWADDLLGSVVAHGGCPDAELVLLAIDGDANCARLAAKYRARYVPCRSLRPLTIAAKSVLYALPRVVAADRYLCLDADMLVLDDLNPIFAALDALPEGAVLACREGNGRGLVDLGHAIDLAYGGGHPAFFDRDGPEGRYPMVVNDGLFAGRRDALLALDAMLRSMPAVADWVDADRSITWRNQFAFNVAGARLDAFVELDPCWNVQLHVQDVEEGGTAVRPGARWQGRDVRVLHFSGTGKVKAGDLRRRCAAVPDPLVGRGGGDGYADFVAALRAWVGRVGVAGLAWSFYGTADGGGARVPDPSVFPLLATLHHLVRSNGAVRVLETGTARGVSAACLASAVAHRDGGRVVSFDPYPHGGCAELWAALPPAMAACIEQRPVDSIAGLRAALDAGERYDAALLDSIHTAEHLGAELELTLELVEEGGLVLCHDPTLPGATVDVALRRLEADGYGISRLWTATSGVREDDGLGLAVIVNRRGAGSHSIPMGASGVLDTAEPWVRPIVEAVAPYTMTSIERIVALCTGVAHVVRAGVPGAFVECGVWRGGSAMAIARTLLELGVTDRELVLFDTFAGMTPPEAVDRRYDGVEAATLLTEPTGEGALVRAESTLEEVTSNLTATGYPSDRIRYVVGPVEETIPAQAPDAIALLRLDTDWYGSTRHELEHLLPRVPPNGVLLVDDYGHWQGARAAVDEVLATRSPPLLLTAIDYTGRIAVIPG